jgi:hypothetical protein
VLIDGVCRSMPWVQQALATIDVLYDLAPVMDLEAHRRRAQRYPQSTRRQPVGGVEVSPACRCFSLCRYEICNARTDSSPRTADELLAEIRRNARGG